VIALTGSRPALWFLQFKARKSWQCAIVRQTIKRSIKLYRISRKHTDWVPSY